MKDWSTQDTHPLPPAEPSPGPAPGPATTAVRIDVAGLSDRGKVRDENQDHFLVVRAGRYAETLATSLPPGEVPERVRVADALRG